MEYRDGALTVLKKTDYKLQAASYKLQAPVTTAFKFTLRHGRAQQGKTRAYVANFDIIMYCLKLIATVSSHLHFLFFFQKSKKKKCKQELKLYTHTHTHTHTCRHP
jgi:hypothetical protein